MEKNARYGKSSLLASAFLWGIGFTAVQGALDSGWHPYLLLAVRGLLGALFLGMFTLNRGWWKRPKLIKDGIAAGSLMFLAFALQTFGQQTSTTSNAAFLTTLYVVFTPFIMIVTTSRKVTVSTITAVGCSLLGTAFLTLQGGMSLQSGDILLIGCAFVFALHILYVEKMAVHDDALSLTAIQCLTMSILAFAFAGFYRTPIPTQGWNFVLYCGIMSSGCAFFLQTYGQKHVDSTIASIILTLEALFGAVGAVLLLHEQVRIPTVIGGLLMLTAVFLIEAGPLLKEKFGNKPEFAVEGELSEKP